MPKSLIVLFAVTLLTLAACDASMEKTVDTSEGDQTLIESSHSSVGEKETSKSTSTDSLQTSHAELRRVHQKLLKGFIGCVKSKETDCVCQYMAARSCKAYPVPGDGEWWYILIPDHFQKESDSDLLDGITNPSVDPSHGRPFARYRLHTSNEHTDQASFIYEDGAWKLAGID